MADPTLSMQQVVSAVRRHDRIVTAGREMARQVAGYRRDAIIAGAVTGVLFTVAPTSASSVAFQLVEKLPGYPWLYGFLLLVGALMTAAQDGRIVKVGSVIAASWFALYGGNFVVLALQWAMDPSRGEIPFPILYPIGVYLGDFLVALRCYQSWRALALWREAQGG